MDFNQFEQWIIWGLANFSLCMFFLAVAFILVHRVLTWHLRISEIIFRWMVLLPLGFVSIYAFIMHVFFPVMAAETIGWAPSPFQYEVGIANLAFGILGILSFKASYSFRLATVISSACWLWGDAIGHIYQMMQHQNFSPGNAGSWFWLDVILPFILWFSLIRSKHPR